MSGLKTLKRLVAGAALSGALAVPSVWSSFMHDRAIKAAFNDAVMNDPTPRVLSITTDGVTRKGELKQGAALENITLGFYNRPSSAFLIAGKPEAACWFTNLQVTQGQQNLPFWQKLFGGAEYERAFANSAFSSWISYSCAPVESKIFSAHP